MEHLFRGVDKFLLRYRRFLFDFMIVSVCITLRILWKPWLLKLQFKEMSLLRSTSALLTVDLDTFS